MTRRLRCSFKSSSKLSCKCVLRVELPGDKVDCVRLVLTRPHAHDFSVDGSKVLPLNVKLLLTQFYQQKRTLCTDVFQKLEESGIDIVNEFTATKQHKDQASFSETSRERRAQRPALCGSSVCWGRERAGSHTRARVSGRHVRARAFRASRVHPRFGTSQTRARVSRCPRRS